jgi:MFS family permease
LLTVGSLSDYIGRRPAILAALALNAAAMAMFMSANSAAALIAARAVQGFATGLATSTLGAAIMDTDRSRGPALNSITAFIGLTAGSLGGGLLVTYAPGPQQLVYAVLLAASAAEALLLWYMPETVTSKSGALASLQPHVSVPARARRALVQVTPVTIASWALGGFYFSPMPSHVRVALMSALGQERTLGLHVNGDAAQVLLVAPAALDRHPQSTSAKIAPLVR